MKKSYTIPCMSRFRDEVSALAESRGVNVGDLARSILLALPTSIIEQAADPGEPSAEDRETVILKSGPAKGRPWRRKPRLQVRMADGTTPEKIRKALGVALALSSGELNLHLLDPKQVKKAAAPPPKVIPQPDAKFLQAENEIKRQKDEIERQKAVISALAFTPLSRGVQTREDACHILGFSPGMRPSKETIRGRFRMLATIHHPDSPYGNHERMSQLNAAIALLKKQASDF